MRSPNIERAIEALEQERAELARQMAWVEARLEEFRSVPAQAPPPPTRPPTRRRRRTSNNGNGKMRDTVLAYVGEHPGSTAGSVADGLGLRRSSVSTLMSKLAREGALAKRDRGYAVSA